MLGVVYEEKGAGTALEKYKEQLKKGENKVQGKDIRNDVFRTFPKLEIFDLESQKRKMTRILHAVSHKSNFKYTQGQNILLAPFLLCMNEVDAFHSYHRLSVEMVPTYWMEQSSKNPEKSKSYLGVNAACRIADKILRVVDPNLHKALMANYKEKINPISPTERWFHTQFTFRHMQTLSLCTKPLEQVVLLLDVVFAMGIQYHVLIYVAQLMSLREKLMQKGTNLNDFLRQDNFPDVNARYVSSQVSYLIEKLEDQPKLLDEVLAQQKEHTP